MRTKKALSWIFSLALVATMIPALGSVAYADEGGPAPGISIGAGNIKKGNKVYMGVRKTDDGIVPISWVVLGGANSSDLEDSVGAAVSSDNARLLITEKTLAGVQFDPDGQSNIWQGSNIQNWCSEFLTDADGDNISGWQDRFSALEEATALYTSKTDDEYDDVWGTSELKNERLFLLSAEEVSGDYGYFNGDGSRIAYRHDEDETCDWWLRSPFSDLSNYAACVKLDGSVGVSDVSTPLGARPAFNFNLKSVLFTSAAAGGKSSGACGADALSAISDTATNEWKLTLKDASRSGFNAAAATGATLEADEGYFGWSIPIVYSGANTGDNEYVSAILCGSNGTAKYYGNIAQNSAASSDTGQAVGIPEGLAAGSYTMYVFNEQINGDKLTDYSSAFSRIELTVTKPPVETFTVTFKAAGGTWTDGTTADKQMTVDKGQAATAPDDPTRDGFTFDGWDPEDFSNITSNLTVTAQWKENSEPQPQPAAQTITASSFSKTYGNAAFSLNAKTNGDGTLTYKSSNTKVVTVDSAGKATIKGAGTAKITISASATANYKAASKTITVTVNKAPNPLRISPKAATVKYKKLKKKTRTLAVTKVIKFTKKLNDKKTYALDSAKKGKKDFKKYFKVNKTTGKATVKRGLKKGTYKITVKVKAAGNANYAASSAKPVTFTIKVK